MQNILPAVLSKRRLLPLVAIGALLAAALLLQLPTLRGVGASVKTAVIAPCTAAAIFPSPAAPQEPGATVTLGADYGGCGSPEYKFLLLAPGTTTWVTKAGYSSSSTYAWNTTGAKEGVWQIAVWIRATGSTASYQAYAIGAYAIAFQHCTAAALTYSATIGASVDLTINATATGCPATLFEWKELLPHSSTWTVVQPYLNTGGGGNTFHTVFAPGQGAHQFAVLVKQTGSQRSYESYQLLTLWF